MKNLKWIVPALLSGLVCFTSLYAETGIGEAKESSELEQIVLPNPVVTDVVLPSKTASGKQIVWTSDHSTVLSADGLVNLPQETTEVKLTATADGESHTFTVSVNPRDITANKVLEYEFESDDVYTVDDVRYVKDKSGNIVDSRKRKLETMEKIEQVIPEAYKNVEDRDKFLASILKSATKRVQTMEQAKKAKELEHEYDKQLPQNQQSLDDN